MFDFWVSGLNCRNLKGIHIFTNSNDSVPTNLNCTSVFKVKSIILDRATVHALVTINQKNSIIALVCSLVRLSENNIILELNGDLRSGQAKSVHESVQCL